MTKIKNWFIRNYGTERGWVRYMLSLLEHYGGTSSAYRSPDLSKVNRLVFVCLGNICRSAYGHQFSIRDLDCDIGSFGLSTTTGMPCDSVAYQVAIRRGIDMSGHRTTDLQDFKFRPGDLLLVMELRQARRLAPLVRDYPNVQVALLGNWARPLRPHIHDPHTLSEAYFDTCFGVIENSIHRLREDLAATTAKNS